MTKIFPIVVMALVVGPPLSLLADQGLEWTPYIVGGSEVTPHSLPYQAFIDVEFDASKTWCGASIISRNYLLTARHCVHNPGHILIRVVARLGVHRLDLADTNTVTQRLPAVNVRHHTIMDAALIRLATEITYTARIQPIRLPQSGEWDLDFAGYSGTASGWGLSDNGYPQALRSITMNVMTMVGCRRFFSNLPSHFVCLEGTNGRSTCFGDSGGPMVVRNTSGQLMQIGISAFVSGHGCTVGFPSAYTRITSIVSWIRNNSDAIM